MSILDRMNRKAVGLGFAVYLVLLLGGLSIVGGDPSDSELQLIFWPSMAVGLGVAALVIFRGAPSDSDK